MNQMSNKNKLYEHYTDEVCEENHNSSGSKSCSELGYDTSAGKLDLAMEMNESSDSMSRTENGNASNTSSLVSILMEKEHMFEKVVTPSDVGKLNRLVIPKQHAEKYFPLDSSSNDKGLLLNFEDCKGKQWRFRYSYWNSSQSYVMTKGWSRFVKEKNLDAGDIVSFQKGIGELGKNRLYIDWRRRVPVPPDHTLHHRTHISPWSPLLYHYQQTQTTTTTSPPPIYNHHISGINNLNPYNYGGGYNYGYNGANVRGGPVFFLGSATLPAGQVLHHHHHQQPQQPQPVQHHIEPVVFNSVPVVHGKVAAKRLRLFGVNMDCPISSDSEMSSSSSPVTPVTTQLSSTGSHHQIPLQLNLFNGTHDFLHKDESLDLDMLLLLSHLGWAVPQGCAEMLQEHLKGNTSSPNTLCIKTTFFNLYDFIILYLYTFSIILLYCIKVIFLH